MNWKYLQLKMSEVVLEYFKYEEAGRCASTKLGARFFIPADELGTYWLPLFRNQRVQ